MPPGDKEELFAVVREAAAGYTILGTTYEYNSLNQLATRVNHVRDETRAYRYDDRGNMTTNPRTSLTWNAYIRLIQAVFPDGEGVRYIYDPNGRRTSRTTFNSQGQGQQSTAYECEGSSWNVARERNKDGEVFASYTYDLKGRPLTITYQGQTFWYVFNGHGDVVALTDATGAVKARYEYDEWGRLQAMYDETGRVREGYGTIGDIGTGPARPVIGSSTPGSSVSKGSKKNEDLAQTLTAESTAGVDAGSLLDEPVGDDGEVLIQGVIGEPTDLVKVNPYRYGGYRYDRETQYYFLQQRYLDNGLGRFLSQDTWPGDPRQPLTLNRYVYALSNPVQYVDITGRYYCEYDDLAGRCVRASTTTVESQQPDLSLKARIDILRQHGFSELAVLFHWDHLDVLEAAIGVLSRGEIEDINHQSEVWVLEGRTYGDGSLRRDAWQWSSTVASLTPVIGDAKDFQEAFLGVDLFTGERLEPWERGLTVGASLVPVVSGKLARGWVKGMADSRIGRSLFRKADESVSVLSTGGRITSAHLDDHTRWFKYAPEAYEQIRNTDDVALIAKNTGWSEIHIKRVKDHLFHRTHILRDGRLDRFDPDPAIADAWRRLQVGEFTKNDLRLLAHELYESRYEGLFKVDYGTAHWWTEHRANRKWRVDD